MWDKETRIVNHTAISVFNGSMMAEYPSTALTVHPLPVKANNVVVVCEIDEHGKPHATQYMDDHRGKTIWLKSDCSQSKQVSELGSITDDWTLFEPETLYDEWINDAWVTNISNQHMAEYNKVDTNRRYLYSQISDPLYFESDREKRQGNLELAQALESQADAAVEKIKAENPWPKNFM
ncbi:hypothetical protein AT251_07915 [Enterovibrio nigricans]|nr:hypothetical protein [Enterovibrio nigricans]PKF50931.1 hypothetical protein AT251_07915 [Enterovibrio nigricans]